MIRRCAYCHGGQVLQIGDAYAFKIANDWIDAYRCNQYVLCPCVVGLVVRQAPREAADTEALESVAGSEGGAAAVDGEAGAAIYANEEYW